MNDWWQRYFGNTSGGGTLPVQDMPGKDNPFPGYQPPQTLGTSRFADTVMRSFPDAPPPKFEWPVVQNETPLFLSPPWEDKAPDSFFEPPDYSQPGYAPDQAIQMSMQDQDGMGYSRNGVDPSFQQSTAPWDEPSPLPGTDSNYYPPGVDDTWQTGSTVDSTPDGSMVPAPNFFDPSLLQEDQIPSTVGSGAGYQPPGTNIQDFGGPPINFGEPPPPAEFAPPSDQPEPQNASLDFTSDQTGIPVEPDWLTDNGGSSATPPPPGGEEGMPFAPRASLYDPFTGATTTGAEVPDLNIPTGAQGLNAGPKQSLFEQLGQPTNWPATGKFVRDAAGNLIDATGKIIATAAQIAAKLGTTIGQIPGNIADSIPKDWGGLGEPAGFFGVRPQNPIGVFGVGGETMPQGGGSYFGATMNLNPNPSGGQVVRSSVQAPGGFGGSFGGGSFANPSALGSGRGGLSLLDRNYLIKMMKGLYTSRPDYAQNMVQSPSPFPNSPAPNFSAFHRGQIQLGDILRANPAYYESLVHPTGAGQNLGGNVKTSPHTPRTSPV